MPIYTHQFFLQKSHCLLLGFLLGQMNSQTVAKVKKERKSIRETCPHFQCRTRQSLVFSWVHQISVLTQFCTTFFTVWYSFVPPFFHRFYLLPFFFEVHLNLKKQLNSRVFLEKNNRSFFQNALFLLAQTVSVEQKRWHSLCQTSILLQASKPLALPGLAMELQACFPYALSLFLMGP